MSVELQTFLKMDCAFNKLRDSARETGAEPGNGGSADWLHTQWAESWLGVMLNATIESCSRTFVYE